MSPRRVALVDDDPDIRHLGELALTNVGGWECVTLASAEAAREALRGDLFDVVLLDVQLVDADGVALMLELRAAGLTSPVVFLTGSVTADDRLRYEAAGALGVIAKPFDPMMLSHRVQRLWDAR